MLNHFAEKFDPASCKGTCDNCASTDEVTNVNLTTHAILYVSMFEELENKNMKITGPQSINAFRGTQKQEMARRSFDTLGNFAKGSDLTVDLAKRLSDHLLSREILTTEIEEPPDPSRPPISYVYVPAFFFIRWLCHSSRGTFQLGPKAKEFLKSPSFILKIRTARRGINATRYRKALQPPTLPSTVLTKKMRPRLDAVDDPVEPFSPDTNESNFDDLEVDPVPQEPHTGTLPVQVSRLVAAPSIQFVEHPTEDTSGFHRKCLNELRALRNKV